MLFTKKFSKNNLNTKIFHNQVGPGPGLGWIFVKPGSDLNPFWVFFLKPKLDPIFYRTGPGICRLGKNCHLYQVIMFLKSTSSFCKLINLIATDLGCSKH